MYGSQPELHDTHRWGGLLSQVDWVTYPVLVFESISTLSNTTMAREMGIEPMTFGLEDRSCFNAERFLSA